MGSQAQTYYDILGVNRGASQSEIRGAYLRLMKRYHPDSTNPGAAEPGRASLLNRCYATLKDPASRSRYDAGLDQAAPNRTPPHRHGRAAAMPRQRGRRRAGPAIGAVTFAAVIALALWMPTVQTPVQFASAAGWPTQAGSDAERGTGVPLPDRKRARQIADQARESSFSSAERFSRSCFANARRASNQAELDSCVLFDLAFHFWRPPANESSSPPYFAASVVNYRHHDALSDLGDRSDARLVRLRERAFTGLIDGLRDSGRDGLDRSSGADSERFARSDFAPAMDKSASTNVPNWETNQ